MDIHIGRGIQKTPEEAADIWLGRLTLSASQVREAAHDMRGRRGSVLLGPSRNSKKASPTGDKFNFV